MRKSKVEEVFDRYAKGYSKGEFAPGRLEFPRTAMSFADDITWHFIRKYLPKSKSIHILDAGGGDGYWAEKLIELGYRNITITDLSQGMLDEAKNRFSALKLLHNVMLIKSDIRNMKELDSESFDFVISQYDAVSYCLKPRMAIKELARVAKTDSYVIVSLDTKFRRVPELIQAKRIKEAETLLKTNISYDFEFPQYNLTWEELASFYESAGLAVIEVIGAPVFMHQVDNKIRTELEADQKTRQRLLQIELQYCTDRSLVNSSGHLQMVGQKI
jgi:ubiquinone/menaquinone biosynthesis C-methylase UbiE